MSELKPLPHNLEAEVSVIGACLIDKNAIVKASSFLVPEDFYREAHRIIYSTLLEMYENQLPIDSVTVATELKNKDRLKSVGGIPYLSKLMNVVPAAIHVEHYSKIVHEKSLRRKMIEAAEEITVLSSDESNDIDNVFLDSSNKIINISNSKAFGDIPNLENQIVNYREELLKRIEGKQESLNYGFTELDKYLPAMKAGDIIVICSRPGAGKSIFALNIAQNIMKNGGGVLFFSLEMSANEMIDRCIANATSIDSLQIEKGKVGIENLEDAIAHVQNMPFFLVAEGSYDLANIKALSESIKRYAPLKLVIVDHIGLLKSEGKNLYEKTTNLSRGMKRMAMEMQLPMLECVQLNRSRENTTNTSPTLSSLRESGALEEDANVVIGLHRDLTDEVNINDLDVLILKARSGKTGKIEMVIKPEFSRITDKSYITDQPAFIKKEPVPLNKKPYTSQEKEWFDRFN